MAKIKSKAAGNEAGAGEDVREAISKAEAVRRAIGAGIKSPSKGSSYILEEFGMVVTPQHFSAAKSLMKQREGKKRKVAARAEDSYLAPPKRSNAAGQSTDLLAAIETIKPLVSSLGADRVKRIVDLLG
jgi:hypothetical protein